MTLEQKDVYFNIINSLCGEYTSKSLTHEEILGSKTMNELWAMRDQFRYGRPDEEIIDALICRAKAMLAELEVF